VFFIAPTLFSTCLTLEEQGRRLEGSGLRLSPRGRRRRSLPRQGALVESSAPPFYTFSFFGSHSTSSPSSFAELRNEKATASSLHQRKFNQQKNSSLVESLSLRLRLSLIHFLFLSFLFVGIHSFPSTGNQRERVGEGFYRSQRRKFYTSSTVLLIPLNSMDVAYGFP